MHSLSPETTVDPFRSLTSSPSEILMYCCLRRFGIAHLCIEDTWIGFSQPGELCDQFLRIALGVEGSIEVLGASRIAVFTARVLVPRHVALGA